MDDPESQWSWSIFIYQSGFHYIIQGLWLKWMQDVHVSCLSSPSNTRMWSPRQLYQQPTEGIWQRPKRAPIRHGQGVRLRGKRYINPLSQLLRISNARWKGQKWWNANTTSTEQLHELSTSGNNNQRPKRDNNQWNEYHNRDMNWCKNDSVLQLIVRFHRDYWACSSKGQAQNVVLLLRQIRGFPHRFLIQLLHHWKW